MTGLWYRLHVFFCTNRRPEGHPVGSCGAKDSERLRNLMKKRVEELGLADIRINGAGCMGRCAEGPTVVVYPEGIWYAPQTPEDVEEIVTTHLRDGHPVPRLLMKARG